MKNYAKVFKIFKNKYKKIPLEIYGSDPYKTLISTVMSARTNDDTTLKAAERLFEKAPNLTKLKTLSEKEIEKLIYPVGFYKTKAKHIHELSKLIDKVPETRKELMRLPGVGRKTANLVLNRAFHKPAISVDTHVHAIANLLGWVHTKNPEQTEKELIKILPKKYWPQINKFFVSIGRQYRTKKELVKFLKNQKLLN